MKRMIVGDVDEYLSKYALDQNSSARLLTSDNCTNLTDGIYYLSLGDFHNYQQFINVLDLATEIIYYPPTQWSDTDKKGFSYMKVWTERCLLYFNDKIPVKNINNLLGSKHSNNVLALADQRQTDDPQIWIVGGSDSHGMGIEPAQRYGHILGKYFNRPVSFLTEDGASLSWMSDQLIRSDVRAKDLVVFGIVPETRFPYYANEQILHIHIDGYVRRPDVQKLIPIHFIDDDNTTKYHALTSTSRVINFCNKLNVDLIIAGLSETSNDWFLTQFVNYTNLYARFGLDHNNRYLDIATDNKHAGPKMHEWYAEEIIAKIKQLDINLC